MAKKDVMGRMSRPSLLQIHYMEELSRTPKGHGMLSDVARKCNVSHVAVSKFFKQCLDAGYLDESYALTADGRDWLEIYTEIRDRLQKYFMQSGLTPEECDENTRVMIEGMDLHVISLFLDQNAGYGNMPDSRRKNVDIHRILALGNYPVSYMILQEETHADVHTSTVSMADRGLEKPAMLKVGKRGISLEFTIRELSARSKVTGEIMNGHLLDLKYEDRDHRMEKAVIREGKVRIPLDILTYTVLHDGKIIGRVRLTFTATVGRVHMPESSALLIVWF